MHYCSNVEGSEGTPEIGSLPSIVLFAHRRSATYEYHE
jgi:hypothetical protein